MSLEEKVKLFGMSNYLVERDLDKIEEEYSIDLCRISSDDKDDDYYPQFDLSLRNEAAQMSKQYELFYCLEKSIRKLISETLEGERGTNWWDICVPTSVKERVDNRIKDEVDSGVTLRSEDEIDFTTFGELGEIVRNNKGSFGAIFSSEKAFSRIMTNLNTLRGPIAHCSPLAEDEVVRLRLTLRDWFRLME
ncbi:MAG: Swt1 family HEPN domain-containing protein [Planctomycetota bacterium]|jgi:hypothetical protein